MATKTLSLVKKKKKLKHYPEWIYKAQKLIESRQCICVTLSSEGLRTYDIKL